MKCPECHTKNQDDYRGFCLHCGRRTGRENINVFPLVEVSQEELRRQFEIPIFTDEFDLEDWLCSLAWDDRYGGYDNDDLYDEFGW